MKPRWLTLTWQERGGWLLPMMLTYQRSDCGNFFPELLALLSSPRLHLLLLRQPCSKKMTNAMFLELKCRFSSAEPWRDFQWDLMKCCTWNQQRREQVLISPCFWYYVSTLASSTSVSLNCVLLSYVRLGVFVPFISSEFFSIYVIIWDFRISPIHSKAKASDLVTVRRCSSVTALGAFMQCTGCTSFP